MTTPNDDRNPLIEFVCRRWKACVLAAVASAMLAGLYAAGAAQQTWTASATMLYNRSLLGAPHYQQPEVQSIVGLFRSRGVLESLARELKLPANLKAMSESITAEVVMGSNTIQLSFRGSDAKLTQIELDRLMHLVIDQAATLRRTAVTQILDGLEKHLADARRDADKAYGELNGFNQTNRIVTSVDDDLDRLHDDIAAVERAAETDRPEALNPDEVLQRSRGAWQERLNHERDAIARDSQLALKKNEYDRAARLHAKRYISDAEFRRVETEYKALAAQNDQSLQAWNRRIGDLDRILAARLDPTTGEKATSPSTSDAATTALVARLQAFLQQRRAEVERLTGLRAEAARLQQTVTAAQEEVRRTSALVSSYAELRDAPYNDLTIVQPAAPALDPVTSNKKKLFVGTMLGALGLLMVPLFLWDFWSQRRATAVAPTRGNGAVLPILATIDERSADRAAARKEVVRTLALRLQQIPSQRGVVAALNSLDESQLPVEAAIEAAECLHRRGERVLIVETTGDVRAAERLSARTDLPAAEPVDVVEEWIAPTFYSGTSAATATIVPQRRTEVRRGTSTAAAGLAELLTDTELALGDVARRGEAFDVVTVGETSLPDEAFAARRLTTVLDEARRNYGVVLLVGPGVTRGVDMELLAARVEALAFVGEAGRSPTAAAERTLASLTALKAPVLGAVYL